MRLNKNLSPGNGLLTSHFIFHSR